MKKRLAFSTVSQVSCIVLGTSLAGPYATIGGLAHLVHQGLMKITLFFCAGIHDERAGVKHLDGLNGLGTRMPMTSACFSLGAPGMIGLPPMAGFVSKVYPGIGALQAGSGWVLAVLAGSTLLNAAYVLPILYRLWFLPVPDGAGIFEAGEERADARLTRSGHGAGFRDGGCFRRLGPQPARLGHADRRARVFSVMLWSGPLPPLVSSAWPLFSALLAVLPGVRALHLLPLAPLPALVLALVGPSGETVAPVLLPGPHLASEESIRLLLGMSSALRIMAGLYAPSMAGGRDPAIFAGFWCLTLAGNIGVFLAADVITFHASFAAISSLSWFLILHDRGPEAHHAGGVYIVLALPGEVCSLAGFLIGAQAADSFLITDIRGALASASFGPVGVALPVVGFGIKAGLVPLHF